LCQSNPDGVEDLFNRDFGILRHKTGEARSENGDEVRAYHGGDSTFSNAENHEWMMPRRGKDMTNCQSHCLAQQLWLTLPMMRTMTGFLHCTPHPGFHDSIDRCARSMLSAVSLFKAGKIYAVS